MDRSATAHIPGTLTTRLDYVFGAVTCLFILIVSIAGIAFGKYPYPELGGVIAAYGTAVLMLDFSTALVLIGQSNLRGSLAVSFLAGAYLFSGITGFAFVLTLKGVFSTEMLLGAGPQTASWIWTCWHLGLPLFASLSLFASKVSPSSSRRLGAILLGPVAAVTVIMFSVFAEPRLPPIVLNGDYHALIFGPFGFTVVGGSFLVVLVAAIRTQGQTTIELGLILALLANALDILVTLSGATRFSLGWYLAKVESFMASGLVLAFMLADLFRMSQRLAEANGKLAELSISDPLTGLSNRRKLDESLLSEWKRTRRYARPIALMMIDVDQFKKYNDLYGHPAGDECLRKIAGILRSAARRDSDICARYGGEEFCIVLSETEAAEAQNIGEIVRRGVEALRIPHEGVPTGCVTISVGVAVAVPGADNGADELLQLADKALYHAKENGRNRVLGAVGDPDFDRCPLHDDAAQCQCVR